jgi:phage replication initiation protein
MIPPSGNTGGKSFPVSVDWLNFTLRPDDTGRTPADVVEQIGLIFGCNLTPRSPMHGYESAVGHEVGLVVCWGGESQRGSMWVSCSGSALARLDLDLLSWLGLLMRETVAKVTRIDLAVDFFAGEVTVTDCVEWWRSGVFTLGGRPPCTSLVGDWLEAKRGRTLYVGKAKNGKLVRCYEKGIQLGQAGSPWVRIEVQLTGTDRVIPLDALEYPAEYFQGAARWPFSVTDSPLRIRTRVEREAIGFSKLLEESRRAYGTFVDYLVGQGLEPAEIVGALRRPGVPRRLHGQSGEALLEQGNREARDAVAFEVV